jgi:hypothetical protein
VPANVKQAVETSLGQRTLSSPSLATTLSSAALLFVAAKVGDADQVRRLVDALGSQCRCDVVAQRRSRVANTIACDAVCSLCATSHAHCWTRRRRRRRWRTAAAHGDLSDAFRCRTASARLPGAAAQSGRGRSRAGPLHLLGGVPWTGGKDAARVFDTLLSLGASLSERDRRGRSPLHHAASHGNLNAVATIIAQGDQSLLYATDSNGCTPLVSAARGGHVDVLRLLMRDADKSKLDVARAVATAQQWQRTDVLEVLGAGTLGGGGVTNNAGGGAASGQPASLAPQCRTATSCGRRRWPMHPNCWRGSEDDSKTSATIVAALPALLELLHLTPARRH